jgi:CubicO group peptidase (beta-lactamase class C family)
MRNPTLSRFIFSLTCCAALACRPTETQYVVPSSSPLFAAVDSTAQRFFDLGASPGLGIVVVRDTQVIYMRGFGYADVEGRRPFIPSTQFYIASTTKSFTGLASAILAERGVWSLDAPLSRFLPNLSLQAPLTADSITIRNLLTHTHGIGNEGPVVIRLAYTGEYVGNRELMELLKEHRPAKNGREFAYGNLGYNVAGFAMEATTGESWKETLRRVLFEPLGMSSTTAYASRVPRDHVALPYKVTATGYAPAHFGKTDANMQSAGGLFSTLSDMARWLEVHINDGMLDGRQVLPAAAVMESHKLGATTSQSSQSGRGLRQIGYGLGWQIAVRGEDTLLMHGGGFPGYATHMSFNPKERLGVVVMANNSDLGGGLVELTAFAIYDAIRAGKAIDPAAMSEIRTQLERARTRMGEDLARRAARPQTLPYQLESYVGSYVNPLYGQLVLSLENGKLEARMGAAWSAVEVYDSATNKLRLELFGNGEVATVTMSDGRASLITVSGMEFRRKS